MKLNSNSGFPSILRRKGLGEGISGGGKMSLSLSSSMVSGMISIPSPSFLNARDSGFPSPLFKSVNFLRLSDSAAIHSSCTASWPRVSRYNYLLPERECVCVCVPCS